MLTFWSMRVSPFPFGQHVASLAGPNAAVFVFRRDFKKQFGPIFCGWKVGRPRVSREEMPRPRKAAPKRTRSELMARVRRSNTGAEQAVASALRSIGAGYRRNVRNLPGSPDFSNKSKRWAIFVNGCFWHHHRGCKRATVPRSNASFWIEKFQQNRSRDARKIRALRMMGYRVGIIWECQLNETLEVRRFISKVLEPRGVGVS